MGHLHNSASAEHYKIQIPREHNIYNSTKVNLADFVTLGSKVLESIHLYCLGFIIIICYLLIPALYSLCISYCPDFLSIF